MKKQFKFVSGNASISSVTTGTIRTTNWKKCLFCQEDTEDKLICPGDNGYRGISYKSIADNLKAFGSIGALPNTIVLCRLDDGDGIKETFKRHNGRYHKKCYLRFNTTELKRAQKRVSTSKDDSVQKKPYTRTFAETPGTCTPVCFFCGKIAENSKPLHAVTTFELDTRVRQCAYNLLDQSLIAQLSKGDMIAQEAKYHVHCLVSLYNRDRGKAAAESAEKDSCSYECETAFAELISYIQCTMEDEEKTPVFQLSDIKRMYCSRITQLGGDPKKINSTRLKEKVMSYFPELESHMEGREVLLAVNADIGRSLRRTCILDAESEAVMLSRTANMVRRQILNHNKNRLPFNGHFTNDCQKKSVPDSLVTLISMIMFGTNIEAQSDHLSQSALSISQLLTFNTCSKKSKNSDTQRHDYSKETPLPLFLGTLVHSKTRSKDLINILYKVGISVSYDRVLNFSASLGNSVLKYYDRVGAVCPPQLNIGVFTTSAVDNLDHNPSATTAQGSFHGTGISLFQHPDDNNIGMKQPELPLLKCGKKVEVLPNSYAFVTPVAEMTHKPRVPEIPELLTYCKYLKDFMSTDVMPDDPMPDDPMSDDIMPDDSMPDVIMPDDSMSDDVIPDGAISDNVCQPVPVSKEYKWTDHVSKCIGEDAVIVSSKVNATWASFHSKEFTNHPTDTTALLPLFPDDSKSVAMIRHAIDVIRKAVSILNPGQVPILTCDQPLFKITKEIQWSWPESYGEDSLVVMLGGLHIKMALLKSLGDLLAGSGWTYALEQADIASSGTADSFLKVCHVKKTSRVHQITACALYKLRQDAYKNCFNDSDNSNVLSFEKWRKQRAKESPMFTYWQLVMETELEILTWDRSVHEGDFKLYTDSLWNLQWIFHALDHYNYARAVSVHLRDMLSLHKKHPSVHAEFSKGKFTVNKTNRLFSRMSLDESHEQNNDLVKGLGGAIGLTQDTAALTRWMVSGPEVARVVQDYLKIITKPKENDFRHHDDTPSKQQKFLKHVNALVDVINDLGNPFSDTGEDLLVLNTREILHPCVVASVKTIKKIGDEQKDKFFKSRMVDRTVPLDEVITKNALPLFQYKPEKSRARDKEQIMSLKRDRNLFSRLYIACQVRDGDLHTFFSHENQPFPPALSDNGFMRQGKKSDLLDCLQELTECGEDFLERQPDMVILDGAAIVNMIKPNPSDTFNDYGINFIQYIKEQFTTFVERVDIVFDVYNLNSLKAEARQKRGTGTRQRVEIDKRVPKNWQNFLNVNENKRELFELLANMVSTAKFPGLVLITNEKTVLCTEQRNLDTIDSLSPCSHEEADTRMFLHAADGAKQGYKVIKIRTVDTDVLVLAVSFAEKINCECLIIALGTGKSFRLFNATAIAKSLGHERCDSLLAFHALTGCDTVSSFAGRGKKTAWTTWSMYKEVNYAFQILSNKPSQTSVCDVLSTIERFVVLLYDRCSPVATVNEARFALFTQKNRELENIPPTQNALLQHMLRTAYQAGHVWGRALEKSPDLPTPGDFAWMRSSETDSWKPQWITVPPAGSVCREILKCGCKKLCIGNCKCFKSNLPCTALCKCGGCEIDE